MASGASSSSPDPSPRDGGLIDHFDRLPDSLLLVVFHNIGDIKALGRCCVVSRRFHSLVAQVDHVLVRVDCVISDDGDAASASAAALVAANPIAALFRFILSCIASPIPAFSQFLGTGILDGGGADQDGVGVKHHSPTHVLKNFKAIRSLRIELPCGELGVGDGVLLKWRADFGSTLESCAILGASSLTTAAVDGGGDGVDDSGSIPESFYRNGGLKVRVAWTISSLIAASSRHYLLQGITAEHTALERLVLADSDGQGVLRMNREQLEELRAKPLSASSSSKRTLVPALSMRLWYAPCLHLPNGMVLKGATLVAIRPRQSPAAERREVSDLSAVSAAFEEPYGAAAKMLVKRRTYCLEMNSF